MLSRYFCSSSERQKKFQVQVLFSGRRALVSDSLNSPAPRSIAALNGLHFPFDSVLLVFLPSPFHLPKDLDQDFTSIIELRTRFAVSLAHFQVL